MAFIGCDNDGRSGGSNETIFYGRLPQTYEICFFVGDDLATLAPSVVCDRNGETAYSFNIEVEGGSREDGEPCSFSIPYEEPIPIAQDGSFQVGLQVPGEDAVVSFAGRIQSGAADGFARIETQGASCEVLWAAGIGPVCREDDEAMCALLLNCCESILLVPPILENCIDVVNQCDAVECQNVLAGYTQCVQPPICPTDEDPDGDCELLNGCCNSIDLSKPDLENCLDTAEACEPGACEGLLAMYPGCPPPAAAGVSSVPAQ